MNKQPGSTEYETEITELDLSYGHKYKNSKIPDAYTSLFQDALQGNQSNFVRHDELIEAWRIFTPILHQYDDENIKPIKYKFGCRSPEGVGQFLAKYGVQRDRTDYIWEGREKTSRN
eukprot:NODE_498_length_7675_cov_0.481389.p8 type:complete len:117 gc:universal NODE_498_length_7675_cov_0.481389:651-301(-)